MDVNTILSGIILLVLSAIGYGLKCLFTTVASTHTNVSKINQWQTDHEKADEIRFNNITVAIDNHTHKD
jgi:hypothetical protein